MRYIIAMNACTTHGSHIAVQPVTPSIPDRELRSIMLSLALVDGVDNIYVLLDDGSFVCSTCSVTSHFSVDDARDALRTHLGSPRASAYLN